MAKPRPIKTALKAWIPRLLQAQRDNLNEADTVVRISRVFEHVLGYDPLEEIGREAQLKGKFVDLAIKIDGVIRLLVEAKAAGITIRDRHIEQAEAYAARNNYRWVLLTNGVVWNLYHLTFEQGIEYERVFSVDLGTDDLVTVAEKLALISRDSIRRHLHEKYWEQQSALNPRVLGKCLFKKDVLSRIRREIRKELGFLVDPEDLATAIQGMLSTESRELIGPPRIRWQRQRISKQDDAPTERKSRRARSPKDAAVPEGTVLERAYKGKQHVVRVVKEGFEYEGTIYRSLTAVAKVVTGRRAVSGTHFFGVAKKKGSTMPE